MPTQPATTYMMAPEIAGFEAGSTVDGFGGDTMRFSNAVMGMHGPYDAPLLFQLSHPLYGAAVDQPSLFCASGQI